MDDENKHIYDIDSKSGRELALELGRLILLLLWKIFRRGLKIAAKFLLFIMESMQEGWERLVDWWHDKDTQEKVAEIKAAIKRGCIKFGKWCVIAFHATVKGLKIAGIAAFRGTFIAIKATANGIVHLRTTAITLFHLSVKGAKAFIAWLRRCGRGVKLFHIRRKRAYQRFRQNDGFKGLLVDTTNAVSSGISMFMEEDEMEATPDAVTEDDILAEKIEKKIAEEGGVATKIGHKIFKKAKDIVEGDTD